MVKFSYRFESLNFVSVRLPLIIFGRRGVGLPILLSIVKIWQFMCRNSLSCFRTSKKVTINTCTSLFSAIFRKLGKVKSTEIFYNITEFLSTFSSNLAQKNIETFQQTILGIFDSITIRNPHVSTAISQNCV